MSVNNTPRSTKFNIMAVRTDVTLLVMSQCVTISDTIKGSKSTAIETMMAIRVVTLMRLRTVLSGCSIR